jgi:hypothetical protein|nr:DUF3373 family protein [Deltaproteobacteria bacterium]
VEDDTPMDGLVLGDFDLYGAHFQVADLANSGLDLYVSGSINETDPNDDPLNVAYRTGLLTNGDDESHTGWGLVAGVRYTLPINALNNPKLGFEYNHGSKYHFTMTLGTNELYNTFAVRGDAYELYYIQPMNRYLFFRAGITRVEYDYTGSGQPAWEPIQLDRLGLDTTMDNAYLLMDVRF